MAHLMRRKLALSVAALVMLALSATSCARQEPAAGTTTAATPDAAKGATTLRGPDLVADVRFTPAAPKVGEIFSACTTLRDDSGAAVTVTAFALDATMPSHGHGMMTAPQHRSSPDCWLSEGMKLHMHGPWELSVTATIDGTERRAVATWQQPPEAL